MADFTDISTRASDLDDYLIADTVGTAIASLGDESISAHSLLDEHDTGRTFGDFTFGSGMFGGGILYNTEDEESSAETFSDEPSCTATSMEDVSESAGSLSDISESVIYLDDNSESSLDTVSDEHNTGRTFGDFAFGSGTFGGGTTTDTEGESVASISFTDIST